MKKPFRCYQLKIVYTAVLLFLLTSALPASAITNTPSETTAEMNAIVQGTDNLFQVFRLILVAVGMFAILVRWIKPPKGKEKQPFKTLAVGALSVSLVWLLTSDVSIDFLQNRIFGALPQDIAADIKSGGVSDEAPEEFSGFTLSKDLVSGTNDSPFTGHAGTDALPGYESESDDLCSAERIQAWNNYDKESDKRGGRMKSMLGKLIDIIHANDKITMEKWFPDQMTTKSGGTGVVPVRKWPTTEELVDLYDNGKLKINMPKDAQDLLKEKC